MARNQKIKRNVKIYRTGHSGRGSGKGWLYALAVVLLIGMGYLVAGPIIDLIDRSGKSPQTSSSSSEETSIDEGASESKGDSSSTVSVKVPENELKNMNACVMPSDILSNPTAQASYLATQKAAGYNAVVVDLKDASGAVFYQSAMPQAVEYGVIAPGAVTLDSLYTSIKTAGMTPVARISTLKDATAPTAARQNSYTVGGSTWLDNSRAKGGKAWLNPYKDNARAYLTGLSDEITKAGFQILVLDNIQFPDGRQSQMGGTNDAISRPDILKTLVEEINSAVSVNGATLVCSFRAEAYIGINDAVYGGSPTQIVKKNVAPILDMNVLSKNPLPEAFAGISVETDPDQVVNILLKQIVDAGNDSITMVLPEGNQDITFTVPNQNVMNGKIVS